RTRASRSRSARSRSSTSSPSSRCCSSPTGAAWSWSDPMTDDTPRDPTGSRDETEARARLLLDLEALAPAAGEPPRAADVLTRPSLLRRLARRLAAHVPAGTDRLLVPSLVEAPLGAAVALATGVPF